MVDSEVSPMEFPSKLDTRRSTASLSESSSLTLASVVICGSESIFSVSDNVQGSPVSEPTEEDLALVGMAVALEDMEVV